MKRAKGIIMATLFALMTSAFVPASSQDRPATNTTQDRYRDAEDADYGWVGLLGLVGLFGLMKKPREVHYNQPAAKATY